MSESDRAVVARARRSDEDAFRVLVERHSRHVYQVAYRLTGQVMDAEDVVQETFLKAHRQLNRFEERADVRTWLHRIAANCAIDLIRARRHRELAADPADLERAAQGASERAQAPSPERMAESERIGASVADALGRLTALERTAFMLRHVEGRSIREIAEALGLRSEAAKHGVFRAVRKMRAALQPLVDSHAGRARVKVGPR